MGESKRRQRLDSSWGKQKLIEGIFVTCKRLFKPRSKEGEVALRWKICDFYRAALENDAPGVTMLDCSQGVGGFETLPGFKGIPVLISNHFIALDELADSQIPKLPVGEIKHLVQETDLASHRVTMLRICAGDNGSDLLSVLSTDVIREELENEK